MTRASAAMPPPTPRASPPSRRQRRRADTTPTASVATARAMTRSGNQPWRSETRATEPPTRPSRPVSRTLPLAPARLVTGHDTAPGADRRRPLSAAVQRSRTAAGGAAPSDAFDQRGDPLADADAHRRRPPGAGRPGPQLVDQRGQQPGSRA